MDKARKKAMTLSSAIMAIVPIWLGSAIWWGLSKGTTPDDEFGLVMLGIFGPLLAVLLIGGAIAGCVAAWIAMTNEFTKYFKKREYRG